MDRNFSEVAILLLEHNADPNVRDGMGNTPLFYAGAYFNVSIPLINSLFNHKANPNLQNDEGTTVLHKAVISANMALVKLLLTLQADPNVPDNKGNSPIFDARNTAIFKLCLDYNADIDLQNKAGDSVRALLENATLSDYNSHLRKVLDDYQMNELQNIKVADKDIGGAELNNRPLRTLAPDEGMQET